MVIDVRAQAPRTRGWALAACLVVLVALVTGCGLRIPADPDGTLDRVRADKVLRVGVSIQPPYTVAPEDGGPPTGSEVELATAFAREQGAEPRWTVAGEEALVHGLRTGELDLLIGGLTDGTPWATEVATTRPYAETEEQGRTVKRVLAVPNGENALLVELESFLDRRFP